MSIYRLSFGKITDTWFSYGIQEHQHHREAGSVDVVAVGKEHKRIKGIMSKFALEDKMSLILMKVDCLACKSRFQMLADNVFN